MNTTILITDEAITQRVFHSRGELTRDEARANLEAEARNAAAPATPAAASTEPLQQAVALPETKLRPGGRNTRSATTAAAPSGASDQD